MCSRLVYNKVICEPPSSRLGGPYATSFPKLTNHANVPAVPMKVLGIPIHLHSLRRGFITSPRRHNLVPKEQTLIPRVRIEQADFPYITLFYSTKSFKPWTPDAEYGTINTKR